MNKFLLVLSLGIRYTRPIFVYVGRSPVAPEFSRLADFTDVAWRIFRT